MAHHNTSSDVMLVPIERIDRIALFLSKFFSPLFGFIGGYSIAVLGAGIALGSPCYVHANRPRVNLVPDPPGSRTV